MKHLQANSSSWQPGSCRKATRAWQQASCAGLSRPPAPAWGTGRGFASADVHFTLLRKSRQYLHSVEGTKWSLSHAGCRMLFPWGERLMPCCVFPEQWPGEGAALPILCSAGATAKSFFPDRLHLSRIVSALSQVLPWLRHPCAPTPRESQVGSCALMCSVQRAG